MYLAFESAVWRRLRRDIRNGRFDLIHRLTPMSPTVASPMASWSPVPFVLGPINGGLPWPPQFKDELRREREWLSYLRSFHRLLPYHRSTYARSAAILAAFEHTRRDLGSAHVDRIIDFPEVGVDPGQFAPKPQSGPERETVSRLFSQDV